MKDDARWEARKKQMAESLLTSKQLDDFVRENPDHPGGGFIIPDNVAAVITVYLTAPRTF